MDKTSSFFKPLVHRSLPLSSHSFPSPETAVRPSYGSSDRRYVKQVFDNLHGSISLDPLALQFVDTEEFQRLRDLKQLGLTYLICPGAVHTRFEHSLGVYSLAERL
jgi:hypothetical protein